MFLTAPMMGPGAAAFELANGGMCFKPNEWYERCTRVVCKLNNQGTGI
jgi:hypothetical protein